MTFIFEEALFQRHGNAEPGLEDAYRPLSTLGRCQAKKMRKIFKAEPPRLMIASPAVRTMETAVLATEDVVNYRIQVESVLYEASNRVLDRKCHELLQKLKHRPLAEYFEDPEGSALREYSRLAAERVLEVTEENFSSPTIYVAGHSVTLPALIYGLYPNSRVVQEFALKHIFDECEAIRITRVDDSFTIESIKP